jgi:hypothetical protein
MMRKGSTTHSGGVDLKGHHKVEGHPDWGWRTAIEPGAVSFQVFNVQCFS